MPHHVDTAEQRAAAVASRQHGALSHAQVLAAGLTDRQAAHRVATGHWRRAARAVYVVGGSPDTAHQRATVAYLSVAAACGVLSHVTAAWLHGLVAPSPLPHVTVPPGHSPRSPVAKVHRSDVPTIDRTWRDRLALTSVSRTLVDLGTALHRAALEHAVDDAFCRRIATATSVKEAADRLGSGRRGLAVVRSVVDVWAPQITPESVAEARLLRLLAELGVTGLVTQHEVFDDEGRFVARLDIAQPNLRWGLEYDGQLAHNPRRWERDERRYGDVRRVGWLVDSVTKADLQPGDRRLRDLVAARVNRQPVSIGARAVG